MAKAATKNGRKSKQGHLPGMEPPSIKEIDDAADELADIRGRRMQLTDLETKAADALLALMHTHKLTVYDTADGKRVEVAALEKVRVRKAKAEGNGEE